MAPDDPQNNIFSIFEIDFNSDRENGYEDGFLEKHMIFIIYLWTLFSYFGDFNRLEEFADKLYNLYDDIETPDSTKKMIQRVCIDIHTNISSMKGSKGFSDVAELEENADILQICPLICSIESNVYIITEKPQMLQWK